MRVLLPGNTQFLYPTAQLNSIADHAFQHTSIYG